MPWDIGVTKTIYKNRQFEFLATRIVGKNYKNFWSQAMKFKTHLISKSDPIEVKDMDEMLMFNFLQSFYTKVKRSQPRSNAHFQLNVCFQELVRR